MRVRFQMYKNGELSDIQAICDLPEKAARKKFAEIRKNGESNWGELVAEDEEEGGYMEVVDSFEHNDAYRLSMMLRGLKGCR